MDIVNVKTGQHKMNREKENMQNSVIQKLPTKHILFTTQVGSFLWNMETAASDTDVFRVYVSPTRDILRGTADFKSSFSHKKYIDIAEHEIGKVVEQLLKGNINFIEGVMSPLILTSFGNYLETLQLIVKTHLAQNIYHSVHGMALSNYKKYILTGKDISEKRCNTVLRILKFSRHVLEGEGILFSSVEAATPGEIINEIRLLNSAFIESDLPEKPDEEPFREWLYLLRLSGVRGNFEEKK